MLYLPLGFWGFQVNLKTQEQKSVNTCRNAEGHPRGIFYTQTDPDTGMVAHCCRLVEELEAAGKKASPESCVYSCPGHRQRAQAWRSPQSQLNQHPQEVLECDPDPSGVFWKPPQS